jgi:hypothetical protein
MLYIETKYKTIHGKPVYAHMQHEDDSNYRFVTLKTKRQLVKEQKELTLSVRLIPHNYIDPIECPKLFEESPLHFSSFISSMLRICKWLMPYYVGYIKDGHDSRRAFDKAVINYEECHNVTLDGLWYHHAFDIVSAAAKGLEGIA